MKCPTCGHDDEIAKSDFELAVEEFKRDGEFLWDVNGQTLFPLMSGAGISTNLVFYIYDGKFHEGNTEDFAFAAALPNMHNQPPVYSREVTREAVRNAFEKYRTQAVR
jgi:hypothetical protein